MQSWKDDALGNFLKEAPRHPDWRTIYTDIPVRTDAKVKAAPRDALCERKRQIMRLKIILTLWLAVIPAGYVAFEFLGPEWLGSVGLTIVLWKALKTSLRTWSRAEPSAREKKKIEKQRKLNQYFHHCERNPERFLRLKVENCENDARERVREEAEEIKPPSSRRMHPNSQNASASLPNRLSRDAPGMNRYRRGNGNRRAGAPVFTR